MVGKVIVNQDRVVRPSQLIRGAGRLESTTEAHIG
jgi:hypothetical protein